MPEARNRKQPQQVQTAVAPPHPDEPRQGFVVVARVLGTWSLRGALKLESITDFPERFDPGAILWLEGEPRTVEHSHWQRGAVIVKLCGIDSVDDAQGFRGALMELPEAELHPLGEDEYYEHDLIGLTVRTSAGAELGRVTGILPTGANEVLVVRGDQGEYLLPMIADVVQEIDLSAGRITVELIEGLEPTAVRPPRPERKTHRAS